MCKPGQIISLDCFRYRKIDKYVIGKYGSENIVSTKFSWSPVLAWELLQLTNSQVGGEIVGAGASAGLRVILNNRPKM